MNKQLRDPNKEIIPILTYRYALSNKDGNIESFVKSCNIDFINKTLNISLYEVIYKGEMLVNEWLLNISQENLILTVFDKFRNPIYKCTFSGLILLSDKSYFDYDKTDISTRDIILSYKSITKEYLYDKSADIPSKTNDNYEVLNFIKAIDIPL